MPGSNVVRGQHIAYVGQLYENSGTTKHENTMIHFELYKNTSTGGFTDTTNADDFKYVDADPEKLYYRISDFENPTVFIDKCE